MSVSNPWDHDLDIKPGDRIMFKNGDFEVTETITEIRTSTPNYAPTPPLSRWRRILRALTPSRLRKPLPQPRCVPPGTVMFTTNAEIPPTSFRQGFRLQQMLHDMERLGVIAPEEG